MKLHEAVALIQEELNSVDYHDFSKEQILLWQVGFLTGMLADQLRHDWIMEQTLKARIRRLKKKS